MEKFDYKEFSEDMALQAINLVPEDISDEGRKYLLKTLESFTYLAGEAIENDTTIEFSVDNKALFTQIISEWVFHKCVDLARSDIPEKHWDSIMQKIAFTIFEIAKQAMLKEVPQDVLLETVEHHVVKVWNESLKELKDKNLISKECSQNAEKLSNIDDMAEVFHSIDDFEEIKNTKSKPQKTFNILEKIKPKIKIFCWCLTLMALVISIFYFRIDILNFIILHKNAIYTGGILGFIIGLIIYIAAQKEIEYQSNELEKTKQQLQDLVDPNKMYERLGVDILSLQVGTGLLPIADPDQDGDLLAKTAALRQRLTDELGYIIPNIRIMDSSKLDYNDYCIAVRQNVVAEGFVYPDKCMVIADEWETKVGEIPENALVGVDPVYETQAYWLDEEQVENKYGLNLVKSTDVITTHLENVVIKYVDSILTTNDINKYIELAKSNIEISDRLQKEDIRKIFVNLIKEEISIKDILLIFDRLNDYSRTLTDTDRLSEKIRQVLAQQICLKHCNENKTIYALRLSEKWQTVLEHRLEFGEEHNTFYFNEDQKDNLIESTAMALMSAHQEIEKQPVILCPSKIRLPLYRLLVTYIPTVVVLSESEILPSFTVENVGVIGQ